MKVLFLDFDGVLTYLRDCDRKDAWFPFDMKAIARLHDVVYGTGAKIVVSSSWRHAYPLEKLAEFLGLPLSKVIDRTPGSGELFEHDSGGRGSCIAQWLAQHGDSVRSWAIVDDNVLDMQQWMAARVVKTDSTAGLTDEKAAELIALLGEI